MDGVLVHEEDPLPGAAELIEAWQAKGRRFLVLTNNSLFTPRDLSARLCKSGLSIPEENIWTSAMATAAFLDNQSGEKTAFVIGEVGLTTALHDTGFILTETDPDFVIVGETRNYSFEALTKAIRFIDKGARFILTNPDPTGPTKEGPLPGAGALAAMITAATSRKPYVVGKPNPVMFRYALNRIHAHSETTGMIGDTMATDIVAGMEAGLHTILVLTGSTTSREQVDTYPYRPSRVLNGVKDLVPLL
jgi:NagD protein